MILSRRVHRQKIREASRVARQKRLRVICAPTGIAAPGSRGPLTGNLSRPGRGFEVNRSVISSAARPHQIFCNCGPSIALPPDRHGRHRARRTSSLYLAAVTEGRCTRREGPRVSAGAGRLEGHTANRRGARPSHEARVEVARRGRETGTGERGILSRPGEDRPPQSGAFSPRR
jgi:hypothetical protein